MPMAVRIAVLVGSLVAELGCKPHCDPDEIFEDFAAPDWESCGDLPSEDDRSESVTCLEQAFAEGRPAFVRVSSERGITYVFLDAELELGVLTWAGRAGRMGDVVRLYSPCDVEQTLDALEQHQQLHVSCTVPSETLCP